MKLKSTSARRWVIYRIWACVTDFEEGSEKQGFTLESDDVRTREQFQVTEYINESYLEERSEARAIIDKNSKVTKLVGKDRCLVRLWFAVVRLYGMVVLAIVTAASVCA